jgi:hypothetical protein
MDKKELIEFLKDNLKIRIEEEELYNDRTQIEACLNLVVDDEEIEIDFNDEL